MKSGDPDSTVETPEATRIVPPGAETTDSSWILRLGGGDPPPRVRATLLTLANGHTGTRGGREEQTGRLAPGVVASGIYDDGSPPSLLSAPRWTHVSLPVSDPGRDSWSLDLRNATLTRNTSGPTGSIDTLRFASMARPECVVLRVEAPAGTLEPGPALVPASGEGTVAASVSSRGWIAAAAADDLARLDGLERLERIAVYVTGTDGRPTPDDASRRLETLRRLGTDRLLDEHRRTWQRRWERALVEIEGDPDSELAVRFAIFHLISSVASEGEAAVGARGLTGSAYRGHVFWDTDVFVLPFFAATAPDAARAILEYRLRRLPAAREEARRRGMRGARFPWESADDGFDVTPDSFVDARGRTVPIRTGNHEEHIVADVA